ncbi:MULTISPECIES: amino acid ABC transporter permease [Ralstonia]|jgi:polar amino acid transport system permease protein|uniref:Amino acid ABC transporter permease n=1 Tax=Ralstonia mojiangensis TaxID=2953895 RepID=A0ABT2L234_9RALS|nr:amino acid ABC transporter permease [Ralstonia mojiangensis]MCO5412693.1 amino acid ABC transporter permease [Ralstonia mojiangensis]MCT7297028.1 amino acid ABC transporter permease [Ralstonia mojiangensis]MCT7309536.1 amino acid ABC transporter permease [Ralstonia mojiangensis]MCT7328197.1 amino acid ABC transporter permease [Ralstonia mojiangensis]
MFDLSFLLEDGYLRLLRDGILTTLRLFVVSGLLAIAVGVSLATLRALPVRVFKAFVIVVVEYHRNVPMLVQILVWYFGVPQLLPESLKVWINAGNTEFFFAAIALALNSGAFISEDLRSGLRAIPHTQQEAAWSIGLTHLQALRYVILPQGIRVALPALLNQALLLFKNSSLAMAIGVHELLYRTRQIDNLTFRTFDVFLIATLLYLLGTLALMSLSDRVAKRRTTPLGV